MKRLTCARRLQWCSGHRVMRHESKCAHPHGHNYVAWFHAEADALDEIGRVIDFSVLKESIGGWIDTYWDHGFLLHRDDDEMTEALLAFQRVAYPSLPEHVGGIISLGLTSLPKVYKMPFNPTAENMARFLLEEVCPETLSGTGVRVIKVELWETENCMAKAEL